METVIIGAIIVAALGITIYKTFVRPSCSCGCGGKKKHCERDGPMGGGADDKPVSNG
jgi:hypothetical protein